MRPREPAHLVTGAKICVFTSQDLEAAGLRWLRGPGRPGLVLFRAFAFSVSSGCGFPARLDTDHRALGCICQLVDHELSESSAAYGSNQYTGIVPWVREFSVDLAAGHDLERFIVLMLRIYAVNLIVLIGGETDTALDELSGGAGA